MKRYVVSAGVSFFLAFALHVAVGAQQVQVGDNVNVLPVYVSGDSLDFLRGDLYAQRQGEPDIAFSSVNPDHVLAFYNDFRAVQLADEQGLPDFTTSTSLVARLWKGTTVLLARLTGRPVSKPTPPPVAGREAGGGMSVSYDGGITWIGGFMPGIPEDTSPAANSLPTRLEAMSDPVLLSGACGRFYAFFLYFTRNNVSKQMLARFQDLNNDELNHTIKFLGFTEIDTGNNAQNGLFLDKLSATLVPTGATDCSQVTEYVVATYTTFSGNGSGGKFQSRINFVKSTDGGKTFSKDWADKTYTQNQGTSVVVNPVTKDILVFWRSFNSPHTMVMRKQRANGAWENPIDLLATDPLTTLAYFDQPTRSTLDTPISPFTMKDQLAFRSNAFPVAAFTPDGGTAIVTWHEKGNAAGDPDPNGTPMIMWKYSKDGGKTWSQRKALTGATTLASPTGLGFFNKTDRPRGLQLMPSIGCTAGDPNRCLITFYESRPFAGEGALPSGLSANGFVGGYDRLVDVRGVLIDAPNSNSITAYPSSQLSRYTYRTLTKGELPTDTTGPNGDVEKICAPDNSHCADALNYSGRPHTGAGTSPFMHDYNTVRPVVPWVKDKQNGAWRLAKTAADVPYAAGFGVAWADNRNVMQPYVNADGGAVAAGSEWQYYGVYRPAGYLGQCGINFGSRNQDVMFTKLNLGLMITAPTNYKPFPQGLAEIEFPMTIWNNTGVTRQFTLSISGNASFAKRAMPARMTGAVTIFANSSTSINVYAFDGSPVTVNVSGSNPSPLAGSITFNAPSAAPPTGAPTPTYRSSDIVANPVPGNPVPGNPVPGNPVPGNPVPGNPVPGNTTIYDVIDYSWTVTPVSQNDAGTYLAFPYIDKAFQQDYIFQVFVTKPTERYNMANCLQPGNTPLGTLVGHISDPSNPVPGNPVPGNPVPGNPVPGNATLSDILIQNTSFTIESNSSATAPSSTTSSFAALSATSAGCEPGTGAGLIGECTLFGPRQLNQVKITVRAYQKTATPAAIWDPHGTKGTPTKPSIIIADYGCTGADQGCAFTKDGPDLAVPDPPTAGVTPTTVQAGQPVTFPTSDVSVTNIGNQPAGTHRYGIYLSTASSVSQLGRNPDGTIMVNPNGPGVVTRLVSFSNDLSALAPQASEAVGQQSITIPLDIPRLNADGTGTYYLYLYVDDKRRVNELNEDNNIVKGGPITVRSPGYGFLGLYSPCSGLTCQKKTGSAFPIAFGLTVDGVTAADTQSTPPRFKVYDPLAGGACRTTFPTDGSGYHFLSDPYDTASGASSWQYFTVAGTRPAFTWQYNFQGKDPATGLNLPTGCYSFVVEDEGTNQVIGSLLGPIVRLSITLTK